MPWEIPSHLGLLRQALLHMDFRSGDVYYFIVAPAIGSLAGALPIVWGGWASCSSCSCVRTNRTAARRQTQGGEGFGEYLHLHSSPPCPTLLSLPSTHLQGQQAKKSGVHQSSTSKSQRSTGELCKQPRGFLFAKRRV